MTTSKQANSENKNDINNKYTINQIRAVIERAMKSMINEILVKRIVHFDENNITKTESFDNKESKNLSLNPRKIQSPNTSLSFSLEDSLLDDLSFISNSSEILYVVEIYFHSKDFSLLTEKWSFTFPTSLKIKNDDIIHTYDLGTLSKNIQFLTKFLPCYKLFKSAGFAYDFTFKIKTKMKSVTHFDYEKFSVKNIKLGEFFSVKFLDKTEQIFREKEKFKEKIIENFFDKSIKSVNTSPKKQCKFSFDSFMSDSDGINKKGTNNTTKVEYEQSINDSGDEFEFEIIE